MVGVNEEAEEMHLAIAVRGAQLDPVNQLDPEPSRLGTGDTQGREGVVVGDRQRREPDGGRRPNNLSRRTGAVGVGRVDVEVGAPIGSMHRPGLRPPPAHVEPGSGGAVGSA